MNKQEKKLIRNLHHPKTRKPTGLCMVEGIRAVTTFLHSVHILEQLYITQSALQSATELLKKCHYTIVSDNDMNDISAATSPSGILAIFRINTIQAPLTAGIVCARLQDPGNAGTLIRSAAAFNKKSVVFVESVDPWSPKVIQASAGTIAQITVHELSWYGLKKLTMSGKIPLLALVTHHGQQPDSRHAEALFVVGNEANGIPPEWLKECDQKISLAMPGDTESLNAAVAGSIALYMSLVAVTR